MAVVCLAGIKIGSILLGLQPWQTLVLAGSITLIYSTLGGIRGVVLTDVLQFVISIGGSIIAAYFAVNHPQVGGITSLIEHDNVSDKLNLLPSVDNPEVFASVLLIPILVQWWSVWYPGSEPGGGGYVAQRMFAAPNESGAMKSVLLFNVAHYALRPWPWILVALASIVVFPDLKSLQEAFPDSESVVGDDLAYPAMLSFIPSGFIGVVAASLIAAFMSTLSTHLNWGASYLTNDFYARFISPESSEKQKLRFGQLSTIVLMGFAMLFSLGLESALDGFQILLQIGAGTGLIFILRWFWMKINAYAELTAMIVSFLVAVFFNMVYPKTGWEPLSNGWEIVLGVFITTIAWVTTSLVTRPTNPEVISKFKAKTEVDKTNIKLGLFCALIGSVAVYSALFATGKIIYGEYIPAFILSLVSIATFYLLARVWNRLHREF